MRGVRSPSGCACVLVLLSASFLSGCLADAPPRVQLADTVRRPNAAAVIFFIDGLGSEEFWQLQREGKLPNITHHFVEGGLRVERAVASLPSITYPNSVSFVTGVLPGHHGITGNEWFDRDELISQNYNRVESYQDVDREFSAPTLYEMLSGDFTATITVPVRRGATRPVNNWMSAGIAWFFGLDKVVDQLSVSRLELIGRLANSTGSWPTLITTYFPMPDTIGHKYGPHSQARADSLQDVDKRIGYFLDALRQGGLLDNTYCVLVSDHGQVATPPEENLDVSEFLRKDLGLALENDAYGVGVDLEHRQEHFGDARTVVVQACNRELYLHLRAGRFWHSRPSAEEIDSFARTFGRRDRVPAEWREKVDKLTFTELLLELPGVGLVVRRDGPDAVLITGAKGIGRITRRSEAEGKQYRYEVRSGDDPLKQMDFPSSRALVDGQFHPSREWLSASCAGAGPDLVPQLVELLDSPRSGDLVLFARDRWAFLNSHEPDAIEHFAGFSPFTPLRKALPEKGGHGGLAPEELLVPFLWAGPGLPAGSGIPTARTVDLAPTLLGLLGRPERFRTLGAADGVDLSAQLRSAAPAAMPASAPAAPASSPSPRGPGG